MRNKIVLFITGCISILLVSCLGSDNYNDSIVIKDAQIKSLTLKHDSISKLSSVVFTIDQLSGQIYNRDSLPYGTVLDKVICTLTYTYANGVLSTEVMQEAYPDSTYYWNGTDSLDFSKPVRFVTKAFDGQTTKTYTAKVNIHTVVPDSMVWELYADKMLGRTVKEQKVIPGIHLGSESYFMYVNSPDGYQLYYTPINNQKDWTELSLTGLPGNGLDLYQITAYEGDLYVHSSDGALYRSTDGLIWGTTGNAFPVKSILGVVREGVKQASSLAAVIEHEGALHFAGLENDGQWKIGDAVPSGFPVNGFGSLSYSNMHYEYLLVVAGRDRNGLLVNTAWSTMNATHWTPLTDEKTSYFKEREGVMLAKYDDKFCLSVGLDASGNALKDIYFSRDYGVTWQLSDTLVVFPNDFKGRGYSSVIVDTDNYMLLFGGKTGKNTPSDELWRGRINRLGFRD